MKNLVKAYCATLLIATGTAPIITDAAENRMPLSDAVSAEHCKDYQIRELTSEWQQFPCFTDDGSVVPKACTISGKCEAIKNMESTTSKVERWFAIGRNALSRARRIQVIAEDFAFSIMPRFIREKADWDNTDVNPFGRSAEVEYTIEEKKAAARLLSGTSASEKNEKYELYISHKRLLQKMCDIGPTVSGTFSFLVPLFPQAINCRSWGSTIVKDKKIEKEHMSEPLWITASPSVVLLNERATIHWGSGTDMVSHTCVVLGPGLTEQGAQGSASTIPITKSATFTLTCVRTNGVTTTVSTTVDSAL